MSVRTIVGRLLRPDGSPWVGGIVQFALPEGTFRRDPDESYAAFPIVVATDRRGYFAAQLASDLGNAFTVTMPDGRSFGIQIPDGATTQLELLRAMPASSPPAFPEDLEEQAGAIIAGSSAQALIDHVALQLSGANTHQHVDDHLAANSNVHGAQSALADLTTAQTLQNKSWGPGTKVALGFDALGDLYRREEGGSLARIAAGANGNALTVVGGLPAMIPEVASANPRIATYISPGPSASIPFSTAEIAFNRSFTVPANTLLAGDTLRLTAWGVVHPKFDNLIFSSLRIRWGGLGGVQLGRFIVPDFDVELLAAVWVVRATIGVRAVGGGGLFDVGGSWGYGFLGNSPGARGYLNSEAVPGPINVATDTNKALVVTVRQAQLFARLDGMLLERFTP